MPGIAAAFVTLADAIAAVLRGPRVRALHLPPPQALRTKDAEFCALELDDGSVGLSYLLLGDTEARLRADRGVAALAGVEAAALARGFAAADPVARTLGFAAICALSQQLFARSGWRPRATGGSFGAIEPRPGEHFGMVGLFPPLVPRVRAAGARLTVLERRPELAGEHDGYRVTLDPAQLATCDRVACTCTVLFNDTLDDVLDACRHARHLAIIGPSAGCVPDPLFDRGVGSVGGRRVTDVAAFRDALARGAAWGPAAEKYVIDRDGYPGAARLLARLR